MVRLVSERAGLTAVSTGEESEDTVYQTRTKLYVMQPDGGWRERGVGMFKLNVRKSDGKGARLGESTSRSLADTSHEGRRGVAFDLECVVVRRTIMFGRWQAYPNDCFRGWGEEVDHV